jgi:hypothetical protein
MTVGKASLLTAGVVATFAIGVAAGPTIRDSWSKIETPKATATATAPAAEPAAPAAGKTEARAKTSSPGARVAGASGKASNVIRIVPVSLWDQDLRDRVKAVLKPGAHLEIASADFGDSEEFITVAHAARNTDVPFMVLKDRVINQGQSLTEAIRDLKPELNAKAEATRARAEARSDLEATN